MVLVVVLVVLGVVLELLEAVAEPLLLPVLKKPPPGPPKPLPGPPKPPPGPLPGALGMDISGPPKETEQNAKQLQVVRQIAKSCIFSGC